jgi:hypothetical protein
MVAFSQPTRSALCDPSSGELRPTLGLFKYLDHKGSSRRNTLVVPQDTTQRFMADDLLTFGEWLIFIRPLSCERSVVQGLVRTTLVVKVDIRSNEMIEVSFSEDNEETQTFCFDTFYPSFDERVLVGRSWCRGLNSATDVFENLIEIRDVHAITITNEIVDPQISFARLLDESMGLANHPFGVGFEAAGKGAFSGPMESTRKPLIPEGDQLL